MGYGKRIMGLKASGIALACIWAMLSILPTSASAKPTVYLLLLIDTADRAIGESTLTDMVAMLRQSRQFADAAGLDLQVVAADTGMPQSLKDYFGASVTESEGTSQVADVSKGEVKQHDAEAPSGLVNMYRRMPNASEVLATIRSLPVRADDVLWFYYSGHGFRWKNQSTANPWPILQIGKNRKTQALSMASVIYALEARGARLTITMSDSCNVAAATSRTRRRSTGFGPRLRAGLTALFRYSRGRIRAVAATASEIATGNSHTGGLFTRNWLSAIHDEARVGRAANWRNIASRARRSVSRKSNYRQNPRIDILP